MRRQAKASSAGSIQRQAAGLGRNRIAFVCLLALLAFSGIGASSAMAGETRVLEPFSPLDGSGSGVAITNPVGIALDQESGNVFLSDAGTQVEILGAENGAPAGLVEPFELTGFSFGTALQTYPLAVDNSATSPNQGSLYVTASNGLIKRFARNPGTELFELADEIAYAGSVGSSGATVDEDGNLHVSDFSDQAVYKFDTAGSLSETISFASNGVVRPNGLAMDSLGDLFVRRAGTGEVFKCPADAFGVIDPSECFRFINSGAQDVAVDRVSDTLYVSFSNRVDQYDAITLTKEFEFGLGALGSAKGIAANSTTDRIYVVDNANDNVAVFGPPVPTPDATTQAASEVLGSKARLNGVVNPQGVEVTECFFEYGKTTAYGQKAPCAEAIPTDEANHSVSAAISGLEANGTAYHFRLVVEHANGPPPAEGEDRSFVTGDTVFTEPATEIDDTTATLNGIVRPEGQSFTDCVFEYGTALDYGNSVPCDPSAGEIPDDFDPHDVIGALTELEPNTTYHFRLSATNEAGTVIGEDRTFTTIGPPQILEQRPIDVTRTSATLQARINPSGSATSYHFEFGTDTSYGIRIPADIEANLGSGNGPVTVKAFRDSLQEQSVYFFRVVATNPKGTTVGSDQRLETLNEHDLPSGRAFELVTPADKGSAGTIAVDLSEQRTFQAAPDGNSFLYPLTNGLDSSTAGGWLRQLATRTSEGWLSMQLSAPSLVPSSDGTQSERKVPSRVHFSAPDNSCGLLETHNPITPDTSQASVEFGVTNLYRWNTDGSYDLITSQLPLNPELRLGAGVFYPQVDASDDCKRVFFRSAYEFLPNASLYEWDEGTLRDAGRLPNGNTAPDAVLGGAVGGFNPPRWNAVSPDGQRVFFTAVPSTGPSSGTHAIFMREERGASYEECEETEEFGECVVDISASETAVPTKGARFESASEDASVVVFAANYGIDAEDSSAGPPNGTCGPTGSGAGGKVEAKPCDLYSFDVGTEELVDLSADANPEDSIGAAIQGAVAIDDDASHVYFAAMGQLVPGKGRTYAQNAAGNGSANIYLAHEGELDYVTTLAEHGNVDGVAAGDLFGIDGSGAALMRMSFAGWAANTTPDGSKLLFMSSLPLTGYDTGRRDRSAVYLYSEGTSKLVCVSCRPDGLSSLISDVSGPLTLHQSAWLLRGPDQGYRPRSISDDGRRVFFTSPDPLASGAVAGGRNVYEWREGQVSLLAIGEPGGVNGAREYLDSTPDGKTVFFGTKEQLVPQDRDFVSDVYAVRVGGGFPFSPDPPKCQVNDTVPLEPNQVYCQPVSSPQPEGESPSTSGFAGKGNVRETGANRCVARARRAQALSKRAKALRRRAVRAKRAGNRKAARRNANRARRAARAARRNSQAAKRCRRRARAANFDRGGAR